MSGKKLTIGFGILSILGFSIVPVSSLFAANPSNAVVSINVPGTLSLTVGTAGTDPSAATSVAPNGTNDAKQNTIKVTGNDNYKVTVKDANTSNALVSGSNTIAAFTSDQTSLTNAGWGMTITAAYGANHSGSFTAGTYKGVPVSSGTALTVVQTAGVTASFTDDTTTVKYGLKVASTQAAGTYADTITFTLAAN